MKKTLVLFGLALCLLLTSCNTVPKETSVTTTGGGVTTSTTTTPETTQNESNAVKHCCIVDPSLYGHEGQVLPINFDSYDQFLWHFSVNANERNSKVQANKGRWGLHFKAMVYELTYQYSWISPKSSQTSPKLVYINDALPPLASDDLSLFPKEFMDLPWLFYHVTYEDQPVFIRLCYVDASMGVEFDNSMTASQLIKKLDPELTYLYDFEDSGGTVYEKELQLKDQTVTALFHIVDNEYIRHDIYIHCNDVLLRLRVPDALMDDAEFWSSLSVK